MFGPVDDTEATPAARAVFAEILAHRSLERVPNWARYLAGKPELLASVWDSIKACEQHLHPLLGQLLLFALSRENQAEYCSHYHGHIAMQLGNGLTLDDLEAICDGSARAVIPEQFMTAISTALGQFSRKCTWTDDGLERLRQAGFSDDEIREIIATVGLGQLLNSLTMAAGVPVDESHRIKGYHV